jgi:hypothetical protein
MKCVNFAWSADAMETTPAITTIRVAASVVGALPSIVQVTPSGE